MGIDSGREGEGARPARRLHYDVGVSAGLGEMLVQPAEVLCQGRPDKRPEAQAHIVNPGPEQLPHGLKPSELYGHLGQQPGAVFGVMEETGGGRLLLRRASAGSWNAGEEAHGSHRKSGGCPVHRNARGRCKEALPHAFANLQTLVRRGARGRTFPGERCVSGWNRTLRTETQACRWCRR